MKAIIEKLKNEQTIKQLKAALWSYLRAAIASVGAMLLAGVDDPGKITVSALLGGILGPLIKALDPNQDEYGIGAKVESALKTEK
ncbi:hypothetical protein UFOVP545_9 [uncultured Caudovirales phage]|uniref:Holin n=1 Tax=uncultured Caudovirales phage TaxID=2100421 RepID=A0A6J5MUR9_9CAUD|nr:hypothetical protein UFOVP545_9 [uncultured Caudovirales phage]